MGKRSRRVGGAGKKEIRARVEAKMEKRWKGDRGEGDIAEKLLRRRERVQDETFVKETFVKETFVKVNKTGARECELYLGI